MQDIMFVAQELFGKSPVSNLHLTQLQLILT